MQKVLSFIMLGVIVYGCVFSAKYPALEASFNLWDARTTLEPTDSLGLWDGVHNGFVALGNTVASYGSYLASLVGLFFKHAQEEHGFGVIGWIVSMAISLVIEFFSALLGLLLHFAFYVALLFKLFFVAASPLYHVGFLAAAGFTWLLLAAVAKAAEEAEAQAGAQE